MDAACDRPVVVLGASSGIGQAVCDRLLRQGRAVRAYYYSQAPHPGQELGIADMTSVRLDLSNIESVAEHLADNAKDIAECGALVCLAALAEPVSLSQASPRDLSAALAVGALSNYLFMGAMGSHMASRGWGRIVIGSSIGVKFGGGKDSFAYALANHASEFIPSEARNWARAGVLTNVIRIGVTNTPIHTAFPEKSMEKRISQIPAGRAADVAEIADFIVWHASASNSFVSGQVLAISGGE